jgi:hypothetical protein
MLAEAPGELQANASQALTLYRRAMLCGLRHAILCIKTPCDVCCAVQAGNLVLCAGVCCVLWSMLQKLNLCLSPCVLLKKHKCCCV